MTERLAERVKQTAREISGYFCLPFRIALAFLPVITPSLPDLTYQRMITGYANQEVVIPPNQFSSFWLDVQIICSAHDHFVSKPHLDVSFNGGDFDNELNDNPIVGVIRAIDGRSAIVPIETNQNFFSIVFHERIGDILLEQGKKYIFFYGRAPLTKDTSNLSLEAMIESVTAIKTTLFCNFIENPSFPTPIPH